MSAASLSNCSIQTQRTCHSTSVDLLLSPAGRAQLDSFRGIIFVGGFSYADVLDSAKGWAGTIRFNDKVLQQFQDFYNRWVRCCGCCAACSRCALLMVWICGVLLGWRVRHMIRQARPVLLHASPASTNAQP